VVYQWNGKHGGKQVFGEKPVPGKISPPQNFHEKEMNPGLRGEKLATNHLSHDIARKSGGFDTM
jgi:hypothetical protein